MDYIGNYEKCPECGSKRLHFMMTTGIIETLDERGFTKQTIAPRRKYICDDCKSPMASAP